jgi:tetrahydromethanopterin S-methyltransferase subunit G
MPLHAAAVEILIEKGRFEPQVALGIAEAIEASMMHAQFVTVPILDARLQELRAEMRIALMSLENKIDRRFGDLEGKVDHRFGDLEGKVDHRFGDLEGKVDHRFGDLEGKVDHRFGDLEGKVDRRCSELDARIQQLDAKMDLKLGELDAKIDRKWGEFATRMERNKAELVRWVFLVMLGNVALSAGAAAVLNAFKNIG